MTVRNPGGVAMLCYGPPGSHLRHTLSQLLTEISSAALDEGLAFVQAMLNPEADADVPAFEQAGYSHLAELIYLRRGLRDLPEESATLLVWESFRPGDEDRLGRTIEQTYVASQDCPGLRGLRRMEDVVSGHKASGIFRPKSWWIPTLRGEPVGCVLLNDADEAGAAEVVYLGVRPAYRRRGFGRTMLRHALVDAGRRQLKQIHLAVDGANAPAMRLYRQEGFREVQRRNVYIRPPDSPAGRKR